MRQREIFIFWLPLFASWLLMMAEGPLISAVVNRLPEAVEQLAAIGIVFSLAVAIESPIINLLATSTALVRDLRSYRQVRRFAVHWILALTAIAAAIALTPLFDLVVVDWLGVGEELAARVRPAMSVMIPWSAAIAWRRFLQGVLIAGGRPKSIASGTAVRLAVSAGTALALATISDLPGALVGAWALIAGVAAEAAFATWAARPVVVELDEASAKPALSYGELTRFHLPLAMTSVLTLVMQPLVTASIARLDRPVETLAAWPLIFQFLLLARAAAFALPETVIALADRPRGPSSLRRFSATLTWAGTAAMALFATTPLASVYLLRIQGAAAGVAEVAALGLLLLVPLVPLSTWISWQRGILIHRRRTTAVNAAMVARIGVTVLVLAAGLAAGWRGIVTASLALVLSSVAEISYLSWRSREPSEAGGVRS